MELHIHGVSKTYANGVQAPKDVTLTIPAGMYGLLGHNGAGKSTLMRMIATLQEPDTGTITLGEINVVRQKDEVRKTLGYLPQEFGATASVRVGGFRPVPVQFVSPCLTPPFPPLLLPEQPNFESAILSRSPAPQDPTFFCADEQVFGRAGNNPRRDAELSNQKPLCV
jgi:ABC-type dipeptide/oligopeptide/nickel transport system ATPase component